MTNNNATHRVWLLTGLLALGCGHRMPAEVVAVDDGHAVAVLDLVSVAHGYNLVYRDDADALMGVRISGSGSVGCPRVLAPEWLDRSIGGSRRQLGMFAFIGEELAFTRMRVSWRPIGEPIIMTAGVADQSLRQVLFEPESNTWLAVGGRHRSAPQTYELPIADDADLYTVPQSSFSPRQSVKLIGHRLHATDYPKLSSFPLIGGYLGSGSDYTDLVRDESGALALANVSGDAIELVGLSPGDVGELLFATRISRLRAADLSAGQEGHGIAYCMHTPSPDRQRDRVHVRPRRRGRGRADPGGEHRGHVGL